MARSLTNCLITAALLVVTAGGTAAQDAPKAAAVFGFGNAMGWVGGQLEGYVADGRLSAFAGFGYLPNILDEDAGSMVGAIGIRAFTAGSRHRGFIEASVSALSTESFTEWGGDVEAQTVNYGPGVALGYQFIGTSGVIFLLSGGMGYADQDLDPEGSSLQPTIGIGVGFLIG